MNAWMQFSSEISAIEVSDISEVCVEIMIPCSTCLMNLKLKLDQIKILMKFTKF